MDASNQPMDKKDRPNHKLYLEILRKMIPEQRLMKAFELSELSKQRFLDRLRRRFPDKSEEEIKRIYIEHQMRRSRRKQLVYGRGPRRVPDTTS